MTKSLCNACGAPLPAIGVVCLTCGRGGVVDVVPAAPVPDPRLRYHMARRLIELGAGKSMGQLLAALERGHAVAERVPIEVAAVLRAAADPARYPIAGASQSDRPGSSATLGASRPPSSASERPAPPVAPLPPSRSAVAASAVPAPRSRLAALRPAHWLLACTLGLAFVGALAFKLSERDATPVARTAPSVAHVTPQQVAREATPSVAFLRCERRLGSGFYVAPNKLLTNAHVVCKENEPLEIELSDGRKGEARIERIDETLDAALLSTELTAAPLTLASAGTLATGDPITVIGNPYGMEFTFHIGSVSNARRHYLGLCYTQLEAAINPGNSGGPVFDAAGHVVGLVSLGRAGTEGLAMALPVDYLFHGDQPLLAPPAWHPSAGFKDMLANAEHATQKLVAQADEIGVRLVDVHFANEGHVLVSVSTMSSFEPPSTLPFRLENETGSSCDVQGKATWRRSEPTEGIAKRTRDFLGKQGLGNVYGGIAELDLTVCRVEKPSKLRLLLGKQSDNFIRFR